MKSVFSKVGRLLLLGIPLIFGITGFFVLEGESFLQSLFLSVGMYLMNYDEVPPNLWIEIARWTAPLATASGVLLAIDAMYNRLRNFFLFLKGGSTAVYGPDADKKLILSQLGSSGISCGDTFVRAHRYILLGSEKDNLEFYQQHSRKLKKSTVYLKCSSIPQLASAHARLRLFCPEEIAVQLFWKEHCMYEESAAHGHNIRIAFLGFGKLGEELLISALQNNLFSPKQHIEYHIFGEDGGFCDFHPSLSEISDPVIFHPEPWSSQLDLIASSQAVIVLEQEAQLSILRNLLFATGIPRIHVFTANSLGAGILSEQDRLILFDWKCRAQQLDHILGEKLYKRAKRINLRYMSLYANVAETDQNGEAEWEKLDAFTRYSNVSSADYHEVQRRILEMRGLPADLDAIPGAVAEELAELEHIRWCRYHYLNNWKYGIPANGKAKDARQKIHAMLVPYAALSEAEKEKDRENLRILFSLE